MKPATTILVIEDERFVRDVTCEILRGAGYRVVQADCAAAAHNMFLRYGGRIQLLLCDAVLPDASGNVLAQTLRQRSPGLGVILASGYPSAKLAEDSNSESANEFLPKPYGSASLISKVRNLLRKDANSTQNRSR